MFCARLLENSLHNCWICQRRPRQSKLYPIAFGIDEPILLCAPTGAGKTNVVVLAIINELVKWRNGETGEFDLNGLKIVYIAPMKARLKVFVIKVGELTSDSQSTKQQIAETQIIVTTPEKWDVIIRKSTDNSYTNLVCLIIIDEIVLSHDDPGPVLEVIIARTIRKAALDLCKMVEKRIWGSMTPLRQFKGGLAEIIRTAEGKQSEGGKEILGLTGGTSADLRLEKADVVVCTHTQWDVLSRRWRQRKNVQNIGLLIADEIQQVVGSRARLLSMEIHIQLFTIPHFPSLMIPMSKPAYLATLKYSPTKPVIIFIPSRRQRRLTVGDILTCAANDELDRFFNLELEELEKHLEHVRDKGLVETLNHGVGFYHEALDKQDKRIVQRLFESDAIQVLVASKDTAWSLPVASHMVVIMDVQSYEGKEHRYIDYPVKDGLQMMDRACRPREDENSRCVLMCQRTHLGMNAAYYNISYVTVEVCTLSLREHTKLKGLFEVISSSAEFETIPIRRHEGVLLRRIYDRVPVKLDRADFEALHLKTFLLLQAHFSRIQLLPYLAADRVLEKVLNLLSAFVDEVCDSYVGADHDIELESIEVAEGDESDSDEDMERDEDDE
ncbi:hypothetical protein AN958_01340 [Leucoagaricus sp. SymC.cos]|nr:hypothetical protein AN958_01340 [Leucoagaricus sp. SymC.cos]